MEIKLVPAHVLFARWFIRIRWIAIVILLISTYVVVHFFDIMIHDTSIYFLALSLLVTNLLHTYLIKRFVKKKNDNIIGWIKSEIRIQIILDLIILTMILHFSGGIENPIIIFYFFHLIIASSIFTTRESYFHALFALLLISVLAFSECYGFIPHFHLEGFVNDDLYQNKFYLYGGGIIYIFTSILIVSLTHMIFTRSVKIEETYVKTNLELEKKDKLQNEYVLRVTHDIKGHLAAIISCLKVVKTKITGPLNENQEEFISRAYERSELLSNFVKDLLSLTKKRLEKGAEFENFSLRELIAKIEKAVQPLAKDKSIEISVMIDNAVNNITGNPFTLEELYSNLLLNAIKYTPANGHIELIIKNRLDHVITEITDSGIGIPQDEIPKIFNEFYRATNVPKDVASGTGLGLSIVKQIVENHNGRIWAMSEVGHYTKFIFTLPKNPQSSLSEISDKLSLFHEK